MKGLLKEALMHLELSKVSFGEVQKRHLEFAIMVIEKLYKEAKE